MKSYIFMIAFALCFNAISQNVGDVIITEIMKNPEKVSDAKGEYFEIFNTTSTDIDLSNWLITDNNNDYHVVMSDAPIVIPAKGYFVLGRNGNNSENGGYTPDYVYSSFFLTNSSDEINLHDPTGLIIDSVAYGDGTFPEAKGESMQFTGDLTAANNDDGANWEPAVTSFGDGDYGTPGVANLNTPVLSTTAFTLTNMPYVLYPNPTNQGYVKIQAKIQPNTTVFVYSVLGNIVLKTTMQNNILDTQSLPSGSYFVVIVNENNQMAPIKLLVD